MADVVNDAHEMPSTSVLDALLPFNPMIGIALVRGWAELPEETLQALHDELDEAVGRDWMHRAEMADADVDSEILVALLAWADRVDEDPQVRADAEEFHRSDRTYEQWVGWVDDFRDRRAYVVRAPGATATVTRPRARGAGRPAGARARRTARSSSSSDDPGLGDSDPDEGPPSASEAGR